MIELSFRLSENIDISFITLAASAERRTHGFLTQTLAAVSASLVLAGCLHIRRLVVVIIVSSVCATSLRMSGPQV